MRAIVPPGCWPRASVDWATGTVTADEVRFTDVRFIEYAGQMPEVRFVLNRDLRSTGMFVPYAVGEENYMAPESEQRAPPVTLCTTLSGEADHLEAWLRTAHPRGGSGHRQDHPQPAGQPLPDPVGEGRHVMGLRKFALGERPP